MNNETKQVLILLYLMANSFLCGMRYGNSRRTYFDMLAAIIGLLIEMPVIVVVFLYFFIEEGLGRLNRYFLITYPFIVRSKNGYLKNFSNEQYEFRVEMLKKLEAVENKNWRVRKEVRLLKAIIEKTKHLYKA